MNIIKNFLVKISPVSRESPSSSGSDEGQSPGLHCFSEGSRYVLAMTSPPDATSGSARAKIAVFPIFQ